MFLLLFPVLQLFSLWKRKKPTKQSPEYADGFQSPSWPLFLSLFFVFIHQPPQQPTRSLHSTRPALAPGSLVLTFGSRSTAHLTKVSQLPQMNLAPDYLCTTCPGRAGVGEKRWLRNSTHSLIGASPASLPYHRTVGAAEP